MLTAILAGTAFAAIPLDDAAPLMRSFKKGEVLNYEVKSHLQMERRVAGLETFIPQDLDMNYKFTMEVLEMKADGIAVVRYKRPSITIIEGETYDRLPVTKEDKVNYNFLMTLSPVNEVLDLKDQTPKPQAPKKQTKWMGFGAGASQGPEMVGQFIQELYRLALFTGSLESTLDLAPKLPFTEVTVGETWKRTVGYQPQALKGSDGKSAVQRLDYTYTYKGPVTVNGKQFQRVQAQLKLDTDLANWMKGFFFEEDEEVDEHEFRRRSGLAKLPLRLNANIEFDLDPRTGHTVAARATSQGGFKLFGARTPSRPDFEENMKGRTTLKLSSIGAATATPAPAKKS